MANKQNGRSVHRGDAYRPSWRPQDQPVEARGRDDEEDDERYVSDRDREAFSRGGNEARWGTAPRWDNDRDRASLLGRNWEDDRDEGYHSTDRYGQGQSGYASGRYGDDHSHGYMNRNQGGPGRQSLDDRAGMATDDRWTGRGGEGYWEDRADRAIDHDTGNVPRRGDHDYNSGYNQGGLGFGGHGQEGTRRDAGSQHAFRGGSGGAQMGGGESAMRGRSGYYGQGHQGQDVRATGYGTTDQGGPYGDGRSEQSGIGAPVGERGYGPQGPGQGRGGGFARGAGLHRGKGPQGYARSDERIREHVCEALTDDDHVDATHIEVSVKDGEVTLTGSVDDRNAKRLAEDVVERCAGVKDVHNQLRVGGEPRRAPGGSSEPNPPHAADKDKKHRA